MIKFDFETYTQKFLNTEELKKYENTVSDIREKLEAKEEMMGWYDLDTLFNEDLIRDIEETASYIKDNCDVFLVLGIGGSYLGSSSVIDALSPYFYNQSSKPEIYYVGTNLSSDYYNDLLAMIQKKSVIINVISKSGTTLETSIAYQLIMDFMKSKYSEKDLKNRVVITTDKERGSLREEAKSSGYKSYVIPENIGGRYSVFSPVGLLPIAVAGINLNSIHEGAEESLVKIDDQVKYAALRHMMYKKGKTVEAYVVYEPKLNAFTEWLKQLYGESLGKEERGIIPISFINTRDLHSLGQFVQEGTKMLFETVINIEESNSEIQVKKYNKTLDEINKIASTSTSKAHFNGNVLNSVITIKSLDEKAMGYLLQFFMVSCAISGILEKVNPFNQEGVEEYKKIMKASL